MSEATYQRKVISDLERTGHYCIKLIQTNKNGIADVLVLKKGQDPYFIEFKAMGRKARPLQEYRHREILDKTGVRTVVMVEPNT